MFWKIYFWIFTVLLIVGYTVEALTSYWDIINLPISICALVGLFSYAYKKKTFSKKFWKPFWPTLIIWDLIYTFAIYPKYSEEPTEITYTFIGYAFGYAFLLPMYIAVYRYAFKFLEGEEEIIKKESSFIDQHDNTPYPTITRRYLSTFIDGILVISIFILISYIFQQNSGNMQAIRIALILSLFFIYEPLFTSKLCTFGQKIMGIRVRQFSSRKRISLIAAYGRIFVKLLLGLISFFTIPCIRGKRGLHDFAVGSIVIFDYQDKK